ncbi:MAG: hypothetical protein SGPRY_012363 [Prymnesium sp.]
MAPALSPGGYSSEAIALALGLAPLLSPSKFSLRHFAEPPSPSLLSELTPSTSQLLLPFLSLPGDRAFDSKLLQRVGGVGGVGGVVVCHSTPDAWVPSKFAGWDALSPCPPRGAAYVVGRTMFETDSLPHDWVGRCNRMDESFTDRRLQAQGSSRRSWWCAKEGDGGGGMVVSMVVVGGEMTVVVMIMMVVTVMVVVAMAIVAMMSMMAMVMVTVMVVGEAVDTTLFDPSIHSPLPLDPSPSPTPSARRFRFLSVFKWEARKGWDALLSAYFSEFASHEQVELVLKTRPFHSSSDFQAMIEQWAVTKRLPPARPPLRILADDLKPSELPRLYAGSDAFVLPSRGEGWGRPLVEAMAMGLPVIATNWSGPTAFLDEEVGD